MLSLRPKPVDFDQKWSGLNTILNNIMILHESGIPKRSWSDAFGDIYEMCVAIPEPLGDQLYSKTKEALEAHARSLHQRLTHKEAPDLLSAYHESWSVYFRGTEILNNLFSYLNKQHIRRQKYSDADLTYGGLTFDQIRNSMLEIGELSLDIWSREVLEPLEGRLVAEVLRVVAEERAGTPAPHPTVLRSVVLSFVDVHFFKVREVLEPLEGRLVAEVLRVVAEERAGTPAPHPTVLRSVVLSFVDVHFFKVREVLEPLEGRLVAEVLRVVAEERAGTPAPHPTVLRSVVLSFVDVHFFKVREVLEPLEGRLVAEVLRVVAEERAGTPAPHPTVLRSVVLSFVDVHFFKVREVLEPLEGRLVAEVLRVVAEERAGTPAPHPTVLRSVVLSFVDVHFFKVREVLEPLEGRLVAEVLRVVAEERAGTPAPHPTVLRSVVLSFVDVHFFKVREVLEPLEGRLVAEVLRVVAEERAGTPAPHPTVLRSVVLSFVDVHFFKVREVLEPLEGRLVAEVLRVVAEERAGTPAPHPTVLRSVVLSFVDVHFFKSRSSSELYESLVEAKYVAATAAHYSAEAANLLQSNDISSYMRAVLARLAEESARSKRYLDNPSADKVREVCQEVMVAGHRDRFNSVAQALVMEEKQEDLTNAYTLLKPIENGLSVLVEEFEAYARRLGKEAVQAALSSENVPGQFVENVLRVWEKLRSWVKTIFKEDQLFVGAMDKALQAAVNMKEESRSVPKASEWLAKYCDVLLKKGAKGLSEGEIDTRLANAIVIFRYIEDKDIFQKFYSRMLAQRLIHGLSVSMDAEELMINKLKSTCGYEFTSKLQRMYTDVGLSRDLTDKVLEWGRSQERQLSLAVQWQVLQAGAWPLSQPTQGKEAVEVPEVLLPSVKLFEDYYAQQYSGRKLTWLFGLANAEVKTHYLDKQYLITLPLQHLAVLLAFEDTDAMSITDLAGATAVAQESLDKAVRQLVDGGLLSSGGDGRIALNLAFTRKGIRFKIQGSGVAKQTEKAEAETVSGTVQQDRRHYLECTIVRIMKTRKLLRHNTLIQEVINQSKSRFTPDIASIKKIIESLIEKQYIQRTDNSNEEYAYLA